jgi:hypothetical protein
MDRPRKGGRRAGSGRPPLGPGSARLISVKVARDMANAIEDRATAEDVAVSAWMRRAFEIGLALTPADLAAAYELAEREGTSLADMVAESVRLAYARGSTR